MQPSPTQRTDWWSRKTIDGLAHYLEQARHTIRIASGFFTVQGYDLIRPFLTAKKVYVLVGYDEAAHELLRTRLIAAVMEHLRQWDAANRRTAVLDLVGKLQRGELEIIEQSPTDSLETRLRRQDHAKLYIFDDECVVVGSANLTVSGLRNNVEALGAIVEEERVRQWLQWYREFWTAPDTEDITQSLLDTLLKWLDLAPPFHVYLKTLFTLVTPSKVNPPRKSYRQPVRYQQVVIQRVLRQLHEFRGSMLVASTGLGKTVMAMDVAYKLFVKGRIDHVMVFAPLQVQPDWEQVFDEAGILCQIYTRDLLDQPTSSPNPSAALNKMLAALERVDEKYLVIVDESQRFRHQLRAIDGKKRHSFARLRTVVEAQNALILLLTATPYATGVQDINNQLYLLPHQRPPEYSTAKGQFYIPGTLDDLEPPRAWRVQESDEFFAQFVDLPVTTVISTAQVARNFATHTDDGDFLEFGHGKQWVPQIWINRVSVPLFEEEAMQGALGAGCFKHELMRYVSRGKGGATQVNVQNQAEIAWSSSPAALREVCHKILSGNYKVKFIMDEETRVSMIAPLYERLGRMTWREDRKFRALAELVQSSNAERKKVLIFTERHATAIYLERSLPDAIPGLRVASTSEQRAEFEYELKNFGKEVLALICDFAPEANRGKMSSHRKPRLIDVLVVTDAYSAGVNLQDASVVVHYDLAWTPDVLIQRAGRILRFWHLPRTVEFYVFVGQFEQHSELYGRTNRVEERLIRLVRRGAQAQQFSGIPVIPDSDGAHTISLADSLGAVTVERLGVADLTQLGEYEATSKFLQHLTVLHDHQELVTAIPDDITSALGYSGIHRMLFLLLRVDGEPRWVVYDLDSHEFQDYAEDRMYGLIECKLTTPVADVSPDEIEEAVQECRLYWRQREGLADSAVVERSCALYLLPARLGAGFEQVIHSGVT